MGYIDNVHSVLDMEGSFPLFFGYEAQQEFIGECRYRELNFVVRTILKYFRHNKSYLDRPGGVFYCHYGVWRSSIDIWRHIYALTPDISLPEVLSSLYDIREILCGQICRIIRKRTFKLNTFYNQYNMELLHTDTHDEYNLLFCEWRKIHKEI